MQKINRIRCLVVVVAGLLILPTTTFAAAKAEPEPELFGGGQWILSLLSLILVAFLAYWTTRFLAGRYGNLQTRHIKVAESICLGTNRHLYLLLVNDQALLVGSAEQGVTLIKEYNDPDFCAELSRLATERQSGKNGKLSAWLTPLQKNQEADTVGSTSSSDILKILTEKVALVHQRGAKQFKTILNGLINKDESTATPDTTRIAARERLTESMAKIRAWKTKGRG